jgi:hypothetical protein
MKPYEGHVPAGNQPEKHQERKEQPKVAGAGQEEPFDSETGRKGAHQNIPETEKPGEPKE